jgi:hypothetical protein
MPWCGMASYHLINLDGTLSVVISLISALLRLLLCEAFRIEKHRSLPSFLSLFVTLMNLLLTFQAFVQHQERDRKPFLANDPEVDGLVRIDGSFSHVVRSDEKDFDLKGWLLFSDDKGDSSFTNSPSRAR